MICIGTSGFQYPEWKGGFYPEDMREAKMLGFYSERFSTTEINYTFYRIPNEKTIDRWVSETPDRFVFSLKAPKRITHIARLRDCGETVARFVQVSGALGRKFACILFQLPPTFKKDMAVLADFLAVLPNGLRAAFEFRHISWHDDAVFAALRERNAALCVSDSEKLHTPVEATADYGYFRLRDQGYGAADIERWAEAIRTRHGSAWKDAFIYFKHEEEGRGIEFAGQLRKLLGA